MYFWSSTDWGLPDFLPLIIIIIIIIDSNNVLPLIAIHGCHSIRHLHLHLLLIRKERVMARLSGLQRDVLALYRNCLRAARKKPAQTRPNFESFARREFEKHIHMDRRDFGSIEFLVRKGTRQLETYDAPNITNIAG